MFLKTHHLEYNPSKHFHFLINTYILACTKIVCEIFFLFCIFFFIYSLYFQGRFGNGKGKENSELFFIYFFVSREILNVMAILRREVSITENFFALNFCPKGKGWIVSSSHTLCMRGTWIVLHSVTVENKPSFWCFGCGLTNQPSNKASCIFWKLFQIDNLEATRGQGLP